MPLRRLACGLAMLSFSLVAIAQDANDWSASDWPDFLGHGRDGRSTLKGIDTDWPLPVVWQTEIGAGYAAPSVAGTRLLHYDRYDDEVRLTCRNSSTGVVLWKQSHNTTYTDMLGYNNGPRCSPVISDSLVFTMSAQGLLQCRRLATGKLVWQRDTTKEFGVVKNFFGVGSTPLVIGDLLVANIGGSPPGQPPDVYAAGGNVPGDGSGVVAFDKSSGKIRWKATDELASYASPVEATLGEKTVVVVFARGGVVAIDVATGQPLLDYPWRATLLESVNASTPVVVDEKIFLSETYQLGSVLLDVSQSEPRVVWSDAERRRDKSMQLHWNTAVYHDGFLYGSSGRHSGAAELRCVEFATGLVKWSERGLGRASVTYVDDHLICLGEDGVVRLVAATPDQYTEVARMEPTDSNGDPLLSEPAWVAPVIAGDYLYLRGSDRLVCFRLARKP